eukprot:COSAG01_NODE_28145_length_668_cov_0.604569_1_plen_124_part_00
MESVLSSQQTVEEELVVVEGTLVEETPGLGGAAPAVAASPEDDPWQAQIRGQAQALRESLAALLGPEVLEAAAARLRGLQGRGLTEAEEAGEKAATRELLGRHHECIYTLEKLLAIEDCLEDA